MSEVTDISPSNLYLILYTKVNSKWIKDLNVRVKAKTFRIKYRKKASYTEFGNDFLDMTKSIGNGRENRQIGHHRI